MIWQVIIIYFLLLLQIVLAYEDHRFLLCDYSTSYTTNSTFSTNLAQALNTLVNNTAPTGFNATSAGDLKEQVTALALCRGSLSPSDCQGCIDAASVDIRRACPNTKNAQIWYNLCMVRYSSSNFINVPDSRIGIPAAHDLYDAPDQDWYSQSVLFLLQNLTSTAAATDKRYAVGRTSSLRDLMIYGYVDCTRDLSGEDCAKCFLSAVEETKQCCATKLFGWILTPSCNVQYNVDAVVHSDWPNAPLIHRDVSPVPVPVPGATSGSRGQNNLAIKVSVGVVVVTVISVVGVLWVFIIRARKRGNLEGENAEKMMEREGIGMKAFLYDLDQLAVATDNFSLSNWLGRGGFGTVYKGKTPNGEEIAVKKLASGSVQGMRECFINEVKVLLNMQHRNLVRLLGCCVQGKERMLVYEYLPNKSLDCTLFDKSQSAILDWPKRYNIILGVGRGLLYLHEDSLLKIVHRDIKASNILLDEQMNPKISDFGLAKLLKDEQSHLTTNQIAGTFGYMAPEYANQGFLSAKADVFSFGVLILEIVTGRKNYDVHFDEEQRELLNLTWKVEQEGRLVELVDATMGSFPQDMALRCLRIGLLCCQECLEDRPTVSSTLAMLSNSSLTIPTAGRPGYQGSTVLNAEFGYVNPEKNCFTVNSCTTSLVHGR